MITTMMNRPNSGLQDDDDCFIVDCIDRRGSPSVLVLDSYKENQCPQSPRNTTPGRRGRRNRAGIRIREAPTHPPSNVIQHKSNGKVFIRSTSGVLTPSLTAKPSPKPDIIICDSDSDDDLEIIEILNPFNLPPKSTIGEPPSNPAKTPLLPIKLDLKFENKTPQFSNQPIIKKEDSSVLSKVNTVIDQAVSAEKTAILTTVKRTSKEPTKSEDPNDNTDDRLLDLTDDLVGMELASPKQLQTSANKIEAKKEEVQLQVATVASSSPNAKTQDAINNNEKSEKASPVRLPTRAAEETMEPVCPKVDSKASKPIVQKQLQVEPKLLHVFECIIQRFNRSVKAPFPAARGSRVVDLNDHYLTSTIMAHFNSTNQLHHIMESLELIGSIINMNHRIDMLSSLDFVDRCINYYLKAKQPDKYSSQQWILFFQRLAHICEFVDTEELLKEISSYPTQLELTHLSKQLEFHWLKFLELFKRLFESLVNLSEQLAVDSRLHVLHQNLVLLTVRLFVKYSQVVFAFKHAFTSKNTNWLLNTDKNNPFYLNSSYFTGMMETISLFVTNLLNSSNGNSLKHLQIVKSAQEFIAIAVHCGCLSSQKIRVREMIGFLVKIYTKLVRIETKQAFLGHLIAYQEIKKRVCVELLIGNHIPIPKVKACNQDALKSPSDWEHSMILEKFKTILSKKDLNAAPEWNAFGEYANTVSIYLSEPIKNETQMFNECFDTGFKDYSASVASLKNSIAERLRTKAIDVANFLSLGPELVFLAETLANVSAAAASERP